MNEREALGRLIFEQLQRRLQGQLHQVPWSSISPGAQEAYRATADVALRRMYERPARLNGKTRVAHG